MVRGKEVEPKKLNQRAIVYPVKKAGVKNPRARGRRDRLRREEELVASRAGGVEKGGTGLGYHFRGRKFPMGYG